MDFVPLIDAIGEPATFAVIGLALGLAFGVLAERTGFCTRSAALELSNGKPGRMLPLWLVAFAAAILATQALVAAGAVDLSDTRFFGTAQSLSGAVIGGTLFGGGMVLTRGCASRLLVLGSSGNLRAVFSIAVIAVVAWATYQGPLVPIRNSVAGLLMTSSIGTNDLAAVTGTGAYTGLGAGLLLAILAGTVAVLRGLPVLQAIAGIAIGGLIAAGWYLTYHFSLQVFEPVQADSLSFMRPLANTLNFAASGGDESFLSMDVGLFAGTVLGALAASILSGSFRIRTFAEPGTPHWLRYAAGSVLMGFGGILAVGCTIGAGFTGGAVMAISSLFALASMILSAMITDRLVDRNRRSRPQRSATAMAAR
ncbi:YeeE/YedE family protein [Oricola thermophila]|uniref:YeeE/YedE family protein n=1 Tax=Oricola thermophila TaxID=2742145 RepID=A0A6N1VEM9_9HYPH|nr:YeeE/YedE family protein [Oricola thermophila]QKV17589.1 YeeE/YedE family protein [Oricola thermophila]